MVGARDDRGNAESYGDLLRRTIKRARVDAPFRLFGAFDLGASGGNVSSTANGTAAAANSGATATTTAGSELLIGTYGDDGISGAITQGTPFTLRASVPNNGNVEGLLEDASTTAAVQKTSSTVTTFTGGNWNMTALVYKLASTGNTPAGNYRFKGLFTWLGSFIFK